MVRVPAAVFDGRNIFDKEKNFRYGFDYFGIGFGQIKFRTNAARGPAKFPEISV
jgi:hypothetical protein